MQSAPARAPSRARFLALANELDRTALQAPGLAAFLANRREAAANLRDALEVLPAEAAGMLSYRLAKTLIEADDEEALRALLTGLAADPRPPAGDLAAMAGFLRGGTLAGELDAVIDKASAAAPDDPGLLRAAARAALGEPARLAPLWPRLRSELGRAPGDPGLEVLAATAAFEVGEWEIALRLFTALGERGGAWHWWRAGHAALHLGREARADEAFFRMSPRLPARAFGPLAADLADLCAAVEPNYSYADATDHPALAAVLEACRGRLAAHLEDAPELSAGALLAAAAELDRVRAAPFGVMAAARRQFGYVEPFDARYGSLDAGAFEIVHDALLEHEAVLLGEAARRLTRGGEAGALDVLRELPPRLADVGLRLDRPAWARRWLEALGDEAEPTASIRRALERCDLHQHGTLTTAAHPSATWSRWRAIEALSPIERLEERGLGGAVERVSPDGRVEAFAHRTSPFTLEVVAAPGLEMRGELIIGPSGTLLRPSDAHLGQHDWPRGPLALAAARGGAVLADPPLEDIAEPVVVLAGADAVSVPNYFHWMTHALVRAAFASRQGWLDRRRLVIPAESRPWMIEALALAGVGEDRLLAASAARRPRLADAWLVSPFDHPGAALLGAARERLWRGAGVDPDAPPRRNLFVIRPPGARRPIYERDAIIELARSKGFECIEPGGMSVGEQVRAFADARAIAAFDGAALTNLMFVRPGVRVAALTYEGTLWPQFSNIAVALCLNYRFVGGVLPESCAAVRLLHFPPTRHAAAVLERQLDWVLA